ncbi:hypothetical protein KFK09_006147 [Dendrobium nobile]|uniref:Transmembrane protein n=1 Tax=Dendrobium nobile TaxID=94219 RepID=A0A8T3BSU5_DENNO|nr:hypothetical protein KFK09_006147 [Dendrobium nobile]
MEMKKFSALLSVLILASLIFVSSTADVHRKLIGKPPGSSTQEFSKKPFEEVVLVLHHRILGVTTNDYENYEPTPSLSKPPFKLIPN